MRETGQFGSEGEEKLLLATPQGLQPFDLSLLVRHLSIPAEASLEPAGIAHRFYWAFERAQV